MGAAPSANAAVRIALKVPIVVIGAGQAGLSSTWHLRDLGLAAGRDFVVFDHYAAPGGAWQHRWPSLTLSTVNRIHDLPGMSFSETVDMSLGTVRAADAVPRYFAAYEQRFALDVRRPVTVRTVERRGEHFRIETDALAWSARGIINATGTWERPYIPDYPGRELFRGRQLHTRDYQSAEAFRGQHVVVVGGGISAIQLLDEISRVTTTTWVTRRPPEFREGRFGEVEGRAAVARVDARVRAGLTPESVVSVTGLPLTPAVLAMRERGVLTRQPMFDAITETGIRWADGREQQADVILWCTGFRWSLEHLDPLALREPTGGIIMGGRLATRVEKAPHLHLVGYGPSASTVGANRAGGAAARELATALGLI